jgi:hypothetical protein
MRYVSLFVMAMLLGWGCKQTYRAVDTANAGLSDVESAEVIRAERLGEALYAQDMVAAKATNMLIQAAGAPKQGIVSGWIVVEEGSGYLTRFIKEAGEDLTVVYDVRIGLKGKGEVLQDNLRPLSEKEAAMFRARQNALRAAPQECTPGYNTVVLEDIDSDGWIVYVLAATKEDAIVVGGHSRVQVTADGRKVISVTPLYKSCLVLEKPAADNVKEPEAFYVSYPLGNVPSEIHVYLNRLHEYPVYVSAAKGNWIVTNGKISVIKRDEIKNPIR